MGTKHWKPEEQDFLRENLGKMSIAKIANRLNRSEGAVIWKAYDMGISYRMSTEDKSWRREVQRTNSYKRSTYWERKNQGVCTRCGKRFAEAGGTKCIPCRERDYQWWKDNDMTRKTVEQKRQLREERRDNFLCRNCGKPLAEDEKGVNTICRRCRKVRMERTSTKRVWMRIHGIKRKS